MSFFLPLSQDENIKSSETSFVCYSTDVVIASQADAGKLLLMYPP